MKVSLALLLFSIFASYLIFRSLPFADDKHFSLLADSFIKNDLFLSPYNLPRGDVADFYGKQYLFYGPLPSILLVPAVYILGKNFPQIFLGIVSLTGVFAAVYLICRNRKFSPADSVLLSTFFVFGTVLFFVGIVNISAYLAQAVGTVFVVVALLEYFRQRRWVVIGILTALAAMARFSLVGVGVFFLLELIRLNKKSFPYIKTATFLIPVILGLLILGAYNFRRFHSPFEFGYRYNITLPNYPLSENAKYGLFAARHIPGNLYTLLIKGPDVRKEDPQGFVLKFPYLKADGWGMAIWFTSPLFLYLLKFKKADYSFSALAAIFFLLLPSLLYYGMGFSQYGYRYSLDFLPLLFIMLLPSFGAKLPGTAKFLIISGVLFNLVFAASLYDMYPLFPWVN